MGSDNAAAAGATTDGTGSATGSAPSVKDQIAELLSVETLVEPEEGAPPKPKGKAKGKKNGTPHREPGEVTDAAPVTDEERAATLDDDAAPAEKPDRWRVGQARRYKEQAAERERRAEERERRAEELERRYGGVAEELEAYHRAIQAGDLKAAIRAVVRRVGASPDDLIAAGLTPDDVEGDAKKTKDPELRKALERIEQLERSRKDELEQFEQLKEQRAAQRSIDSGVERAMGIRESANLRKRWPHVAALKPPILRACMTSLVEDAVMRTPKGKQVSLDPLVDQLERYVADIREGFSGADWLREQDEAVERLEEDDDGDEEETRRQRTPARLVNRREREGERDIGDMSEAEKDRELRRLYRSIGRDYNKA